MWLDLMRNLSVGATVILITLVIHAVALDVLIRIVQKMLARFRRRVEGWHGVQLAVLLITGCGIIATHSLEIWIWAFVYLGLGIDQLLTLEHALYFSIVSFTTVGYGDIVLSEQWRLLGGCRQPQG